MIALLVVLLLLVLGVVVVDAFGAWALSRRKPWISGVFLLAAATTVVAAVAVGYGLRFASWILAGGLLLSWAASFLNAAVVLGKVELRYHLLRAFVLLVIQALAILVLA